MSDLELLLLSKVATREEMDTIVPLFSVEDDDDEEDGLEIEDNEEIDPDILDAEDGEVDSDKTSDVDDEDKDE